jgi:hypothetical protein
MNADTSAPGKARKPGGRKARSSANELVAVVQCEGFRCMARRDANNVWRYYHSGKVLPKVKEVVFLIAPDSPASNPLGLREAQ